MDLVNLHTHSFYCDGKDSLENFIKEAIKKQFISLGFSSHAPLPFAPVWAMKPSELPKYIAEIDTLKEKYKNELEIYKSLEIDFIPNISGPSNFKKYSLDYTIGSIHILGKLNNNEPFGIDYSKTNFNKGLETIFNNDIRKMVKTYYENINLMVTTDPPDIIGHFDIIKKFNLNNIYFNEEDSWYKSLVNNSLDIISKSNCILEVNTRGMYKGLTKYPYPGLYILKESYNFGIPVTISTDAHHPDDLIKYYHETSELLMEAGYKEFYILKNGKWNSSGLN